MNFLPLSQGRISCSSVITGSRFSQLFLKTGILFLHFTIITTRKCFPFSNQKLLHCYLQTAIPLLCSSAAALKRFSPPSSVSHSLGWKVLSLSPSDVICCIPEDSYCSFVDFFQLVPSFSAVDTALELACPVTGSTHHPTSRTAVPNGTFFPPPCNWRIKLHHVHPVTNYVPRSFCQAPAHLALPYLCPFISFLLRKQSFGLYWVMPSFLSPNL